MYDLDRQLRNQTRAFTKKKKKEKQEIRYHKDELGSAPSSYYSCEERVN